MKMFALNSLSLIDSNRNQSLFFIIKRNTFNTMQFRWPNACINPVVYFLCSHALTLGPLLTLEGLLFPELANSYIE